MRDLSCSDGGRIRLLPRISVGFELFMRKGGAAALSRKGMGSRPCFYEGDY